MMLSVLSSFPLLFVHTLHPVTFSVGQWQEGRGRDSFARTDFLKRYLGYLQQSSAAFIQCPCAIQSIQVPYI